MHLFILQLLDIWCISSFLLVPILWCKNCSRVYMQEWTCWVKDGNMFKFYQVITNNFTLLSSSLLSHLLSSLHPSLPPSFFPSFFSSPFLPSLLSLSLDLSCLTWIKHSPWLMTHYHHWTIQVLPYHLSICLSGHLFIYLSMQNIPSNQEADYLAIICVLLFYLKSFASPVEVDTVLNFEL